MTPKPSLAPLHKPSSPYLVVVVGRLGAGIIASDCDTLIGARIARGRLKHEDPDLDFAIVHQGQGQEAA